MELIRIADYSTKAQGLLYETVLGRPDIWDVPFETLSQHRTIRALLGHCIGAEQRWISRIVGAPLPDRYEDAIADSPDAVHADWRAIRARTTGIILGADQSELNRSVAISLGHRPDLKALTVEDIVYQVLNHENYHRGQCSMLLQHHAIDPPDFDYVLFSRV